ncbi:MAG: lamin tail domain-containing protein [Patescibacteria group bacterium]
MQKHRTSLRRLVSCALMVATAALSPLNALEVRAATPAVVIGEVAWAGSSLSQADEWVELWNLSDSPVALAGWSLRGAGESGRTIFFPAEAVIQPASAFVIANYSASDTKSALLFAPQVVTTTVSLSNSALVLELRDAEGDLVDAAGDGKTPFAGSSATPKASMLRQPDLTGQDPLAWSTATSSQNLKTENADLGTPGICDGCLLLEATPEPEPEVAADATSTEPLIDDTATTTDSIESSVSSSETGLDETALESASTTENATETLLSGSATTTVAVATSTPDIVSLEITATSTPATIQTEVQTASLALTPSAPAPTAASSTPSKPNFGMLRLNEIMSNPASGKEWVEIMTLDAGNAINLKGCQLFDGQGRIYTFKTKTLDPLVNRYLKLELSTARLNNNGDSVSLYSPEGMLIDSVTFPKVGKGHTWIRHPAQFNAWVESALPTPGEENAYAETMATNEAASDTVTLPIEQSATEESAVSSTQFMLEMTPLALPVAINAKTTEIALKKTSSNAASKAATTKSSVSKKTKTATQTKTPTKTSAKTPTDPIIPYTFDMLQDTDQLPLRVRLEGAVSSIPGLLTGHAFVLSSAAGRGIMVSVPTSKKLPELGSGIAVTGKLQVNDKGIPYLKLLTKDTFVAAEKFAPQPRAVDLTAPSDEDTWALMAVTGTVKEISGRTVKLDLGDAEIQVAIRSVVRYRPQRLVAGDLINVTGVLDLTKDTPTILPRVPEDIVLLKHAEPKALAAAQAPAPILPGWTPLGAAAGAIAVTESAKHLQRRRKQKQLEKKLTTLTEG